VTKRNTHVFAAKMMEVEPVRNWPDFPQPPGSVGQSSMPFAVANYITNLG